MPVGLVVRDPDCLTFPSASRIEGGPRRNTNQKEWGKLTAKESMKMYPCIFLLENRLQNIKIDLEWSSCTHSYTTHQAM